MKARTRLLLLICLSGLFLGTFSRISAQHFVVYGFVLNSQTGEPVAGQRVIIKSDTNEQYFSFVDTLSTNFEGYFIDTIYYPYDHYTPFEVFTYDCFGNIHLYKFSAPIPDNPYYFHICTGIPLTCYANFSYTLNSNTSLQVDFSNLSVNADDYFWDFGDMTFSSLKNPVKVYANPGTYAVKLKIHDQFHFCEDSIVKYINVSNVFCNAVFSYTQNPHNPLEVQFTDQSNGAVNYYYWDFGDGTGSAVRNPFKQYSIPGNYKVTLHVFDSQPVYNTTDSAYSMITFDQEDYLNFGGQVFDGLFPVNYGYSELYRQEDNSFVYEASTTANDQGVYYYFKKYKGNYLLRTHDVFVSGSTYTLPCYYGNQIFWQETDPLALTQSAFNYDIQLPHTLDYPQGTCEIEGYISRKSGTVFHPAANITLFLLNSDMQAYTVVYSDSEGHFVFPHVAYGTYIVYPEIPGIYTSPYTVTLTEEDPNVKNIFFVLDHAAVTAISEQAEEAFSRVQLFPNPCTHEASLLLIPAGKTSCTIQVSDMQCRILYSTCVNLNQQEDQVYLPAQNWSPGTYFVSIRSQDQRVQTLKLVKIE